MFVSKYPPPPTLNPDIWGYHGSVAFGGWYQAFRKSTPNILPLENFLSTFPDTGQKGESSNISRKRLFSIIFSKELILADIGWGVL